MTSAIVKRGALIVFEGCDRAGKTTQCQNLVAKLTEEGHRVRFMNFPDRSTQCGQLINSYLTRKDNFTDEGIHLLFTLNRWEKKKEMEQLLLGGETLIVDRYSYSGVAFSAAKGLDMKWCKAPEAGLLRPDLVVMLTLTPEAMAKRAGFGDERYEVPAFQQLVKKQYDILRDDTYWAVLDADKAASALTDELSALVRKTMADCSNKAIDTLW